MPLIAFIGCDGSGKSTVISEVIGRLAADGSSVTSGHWRPDPIRRRAGTSGDSSADDPHGQPPRGPLASVLKLGWIWGNWWLARVTGQLRCGRSEWLVYDRYHGDLLVDPRRYRYGGPAWLAQLASAWMPQPSRIIFLDAPVEVLLERKQELPAAKLRELRRRYLALCKRGSRFRIVDASRPLEEVVGSVLAELDEWRQA